MMTFLKQVDDNTLNFCFVFIIYPSSQYEKLHSGMKFCSF